MIYFQLEKSKGERNVVAVFGGILLFLSFVAFIVFLVLAVKSIFKKDGLIKSNLKIVGVSFVLMFVSLMIIGANADVDTTNTTTKKESTAPKKEKLTPEQIAKQKAEQEAKAKAEAAKKKAEEEAKKKADALAAAKAKAEAEAKAKADAIKKKEAAVKKAHKEYEEWIESLFSLWDGSIPEVNKMIKENLNDPDSFKHDETTYEDLGYQKGIRYLVNFRAKNAFGGVIRQQFTGTIEYKTNMIHGNFVQ